MGENEKLGSGVGVQFANDRGQGWVGFCFGKEEKKRKGKTRCARLVILLGGLEGLLLN